MQYFSIIAFKYWVNLQPYLKKDTLINHCFLIPNVDEIAPKNSDELVAHIIEKCYTQPSFNFVRWYTLLTPGRTEGSVRSQVLDNLNKDAEKIVGSFESEQTDSEFDTMPQTYFTFLVYQKYHEKFPDRTLSKRGQLFIEIINKLNTATTSLVLTNLSLQNLDVITAILVTRQENAHFTITKLALDNTDIITFNFIGQLSTITLLDLENNKRLKSFNPEPDSLPALTDLRLQNNPELEDVNLSRLPGLRFVDITNTPKLSPEKKAIIEKYCKKNGITLHNFSEEEIADSPFYSY